VAQPVMLGFIASGVFLKAGTIQRFILKGRGNLPKMGGQRRYSTLPIMGSQVGLASTLTSSCGSSSTPAVYGPPSVSQVTTNVKRRNRK